MDVALAGLSAETGAYLDALSRLDGARVVAVAADARADDGAGDGADEAAPVVGGLPEPTDRTTLPCGAGVVIVAGPPSTRLEDALRSVGGGSWAEVASPIGATLADADRLVRVADAGATLSFLEPCLHAPGTSEALRTVSDLGPLNHLAVRVFGTPRSSGPLIGDLAPPAVALALAFLHTAIGSAPIGSTRIGGTASTGSSSNGPSGTGAADEVVGVRATADDATTMTITLRTRSGLRVSLDIGAADDRRPAVWDLQAASDDGVVWLQLLPEASLEVSGVEVSLPTPITSSRHTDELGYVEALRPALTGTNRSAWTSLHFGRRVLEVLCAAGLSVRVGGEVPLPFIGPRDRSPEQHRIGS